MNSRWKKTDIYGQILVPGDVCIYNRQIVIYKGDIWGGKTSKGEFGTFITPGGNRSIKYTSVVFAFDPMGERRSKAAIVQDLTRKFYEGEKK